ncbi:hypothetical protein D3C75_1080280 [compost metagenome]
MALWFRPPKVNGITPRFALVRGITQVSPSTILVAGQPLAEKRLSKKCIGIKMAGHVLQEATVEERLLKDQPMPFTPIVQKIIASTMSLKRRHSISTGIHSGSRSQKKWVQQARVS